MRPESQSAGPRFDPKRAVRVAVPFAVCGVAAWGPTPPLAAAAFLAGLLGGPPAIAGALLGTLISHVAAAAPAAPDVGEALVALIVTAIAGTAPWLVFRHRRGLGRGLPDFASYGWLLAAGALAALLIGAVDLLAHPVTPEVARFHRSPLTDGFAALLVRAFGVFAAIGATAPWATVVADLHARRWMEPIPGETPAHRSLGYAPRIDPLDATSTTRVLAAPPRQPARSLMIALVSGASVSASIAIAVHVAPTAGQWLAALAFGPIFIGAIRFGLRGAAVVSSLVTTTFAFLVSIDALIGTADPSVTSTAAGRSVMALLLIFGVVGAFLGIAGEREQALREQVVHRNQLLRGDLLRLVQALTRTVGVKDAYTEGHLRRVADHAVRVAEAMGVEGTELEMIYYASMLHDVGKIGVPETILGKAGPLTVEETEIMQRHAEVGAQLLRDLDMLQGAAPLVLHHQERWDGRRDGAHPGYPAGLEGRAIPLGARIIAVVDAFDAMTTDRPYRKALAVEDASAELAREAGKQFDPRVVEAFLSELDLHPWTEEVA